MKNERRCLTFILWFQWVLLWIKIREMRMLSSRDDIRVEISWIGSLFYFTFYHLYPLKHSKSSSRKLIYLKLMMAWFGIITSNSKKYHFLHTQHSSSRCMQLTKFHSAHQCQSSNWISQFVLFRIENFVYWWYSFKYNYKENYTLNRMIETNSKWECSRWI